MWTVWYLTAQQYEDAPRRSEVIAGLVYNAQDVPTHAGRGFNIHIPPACGWRVTIYHNFADDFYRALDAGRAAGWTLLASNDSPNFDDNMPEATVHALLDAWEVIWRGLDLCREHVPCRPRAVPVAHTCTPLAL